MSCKNIIMIVLLFDVIAYGWRQNEMEVCVYLTNRIEADRLHALNLIGDIHLTAGFAIVYVIPSELQLIENINLPYTMIENNLNEFWEKQRAQIREQGISYDQILKSINNLASSNPNICKKYIFGKSVQGKELALLKISDNVEKEENEPEIIFDGSTHGNEIGGAYVLEKFAKKLCEGYGRDTKLTELVNKTEIWIFCMVNPDKLGKARTNANGVDLNRNYGYKTKGFSEPESKGMRDALLANQFVIQITLHSGMVGLLYPWCHTGSDTPDEKYLKNVCQVYSDKSTYPNLTFVQSFDDYATTGETVDFSYGALGTMAITQELSKSKSQTSQIYEQNEGAFIAMIEYSGYGVGGRLIDATAKKPVTGIVYVNNHFPTYSDPQVGDYHKYIPAGTYSIKVFANGYKPKTVDNISVQDKKTTIKDIELERDITNNSKYAFRVVNAGKGAGNTPNVLGPPDNKTCSGDLTVDMQVLIPKGKITVHGGGNYTVSAAKEIDGPWQSLGSGTEFELKESAQFIQIKGGAVDAVESAWDLPTFVKDGHKSFVIAGKLFNVRVNNKGNKKISFDVTHNGPYTLQVYTVRGKLCWNVKNFQSIGKHTWKSENSGFYVMRIVSTKDEIIKNFIVF